VVVGKKILGMGAAALGVSVLALGGTGASAAAPRATVTINGAGSTFIAPLLQGQIIPGFTGANSSVQVNYQAIGSGAGISLFQKGNVDFAGSDALLKPSQETIAKATCGGGAGGGVFKIPTTIGAVALIYNLPGVNTGLKLSPSVVAKIFLGQITNWNDAQIARLNSSVRLPSVKIQTIHRADGSGTTYIFTNYLKAVDTSWASQIGAGATVAWPNGTGAPQSSGVSAAVGQTQGGVSYVDLAYAIKNHLNYARVQNSRGEFVAPGIASASAAAASFASSIPSDLQQIIVNSKSSGAYPITGYSYIFMCNRQSGTRGRTLVNFVRYAVTTGQAHAGLLYYAPLPKNVQSADVAALNRIAR